jgi:hypothetical protein
MTESSEIYSITKEGYPKLALGAINEEDTIASAYQKSIKALNGFEENFEHDELAIKNINIQS